MGERVTEFLNNNKAVNPTNVKTDSNTGVISGELAIDDNASQEDKVAFMSNADLFENPELANTPGATVGSNPKFDYDDNSNPNIIQKGKISVMAKPMSGVISNASTPSTGGLENNNNIKTSIDNYYNITKKYENDSSDNYTWTKVNIDDLSNLHVGDLIRVDHKKMGDVEDDTLEKYKYYAVSKIYKDKDIVGYRVLVNDYTSIKKDVASLLKKVLIPKSESVIPKENIGFVEVGTRDVGAKNETKGIDRAELTANFMGELRTSGKEIKAGSLTAENFIKHLQDEGIELGATQEDIDGAITNVKAVMNSLLGTAFASSVGEVMCDFYWAFFLSRSCEMVSLVVWRFCLFRRGHFNFRWAWQ